MTKEEAIKLIDDRMCFGRGKWSEHHRPERDVYWQAGEMAIEALEAEQLPSAQPEQLGTNLAQLGTDLISRQTAIDALDVLCQEHRYKIPGKGETYSQYNEAWQDALDRAEGAIFNLPSAHPEIIRCKDCKHYQYADNRAFGFPVRRCEWTGFEDVDDNDFCSRAERREVTK